MGTDDRTDRFRPVFEPEDIFDRFVRNANASTDEPPPRDDEPTGRVTTEHVHAAQTVVNRAESDPKVPTGLGAASERPTEVRAPLEVPAAARRPADEPADGGAASARGGRSGAGRLGLREAVTVPQDLRQLARSTAQPTASASPHSAPTSRPSPNRAQPLPPRGGPPSWDHAITVRGAPADAGGSAGTRPDCPLPLKMARAFGGEAPGEDRAEDVAEHVAEDIAGDVVEDDEDDDLAEDDDYTVPRGSPLTTESGQRVLLLTRVKQPLRSERARPAAAGGAKESEPGTDMAPGSGRWRSVVSPGGQHTQRLEAMRVIPDVEAASKKADATYVGEGVEDGQMPTRQLDQILGDMAVLLRYGHAAQVRERLEDLRRTYPEDLLLMRRIAEFHVEHDQGEAALDTLFALAGGLFERRNVQGMRQALEQVLVLDPDNARAYRLLGLLEQRPAAPE